MLNSIQYPTPHEADTDLLNSLRHLAPSLDPQHRSRLEDHIEKIVELPPDHRVAPAAFAWYRELALMTLYPENDKPLVHLGFDALGDSHLNWQALKPNEILTVTPEDARSPYKAHGWAKLLNEGTDGFLSLEAPTDTEFHDFLESVDAALAVFKRHAMRDYAEWREAMRMIVAVKQSDDSEIGLAGGSSLFLPGVMVVNVKHCDSNANTLATLVHEAAHVKLNSLCSHEPLSLNAADARYSSPLRSDDRPMEGVIHATFVCATIVDLFSRIAASLGDSDDAVDYMQLANEHIEPVRVHTQQIASDGELTRGGEQVLAYIRSVERVYTQF